MNTKNHAGVERVTRELLTHAKHDGRLHDLRATALAMLGDRAGALTHAREALGLLGSDPGVAKRAISVLQRAGAYEEALTHAERAVYAHPKDDGFARLRITLLTDLGRGGEAAGALEKLEVSLGESAPAGTRASLTLLAARLAPKHLDAGPVIDRLSALVGSDAAPGFVRPAAFQLGRLLENQGDYDKAFDAYTLGNEADKPGWDPGAHSARVSALIDAWGSLDTVPESSIDGSRLVFVFGMMRSGTSLLEQMLAQLGGVTGAGELDAVLPRVAKVERHTARGLVPMAVSTDRYTQETVDAIARAAAGVYDGIERAGVLIDKQTEHAFAVPLLRRLFPGCTLVHTRRDALDCCVSNYVQSYAQDHPHARDLAWLGAYRKDHERMMDAWHALEGLGMLEIDYSDLVKDPEVQTKRVCDAAGIAWSGDVLAFHGSGRAVATASMEQVREPLHTRSVGRAQRFSGRLGPLRAALETG